MKIKCGGCGQKYRIDDDQIKGVAKSTLPCPKCGQTIAVGPTNHLFGETLKTKILNEVKALPPMPQVLIRARAVVDDPMKSTADLAEVLETDQAMTARVIKVANSAFYGLRTPVTSVKNASVILGESTLMTLITMVSSERLMGKRLKGYGFDSTAMFSHALAVAFVSKELAQARLADFQNDAFVAGLLHDIGKLILDPYVADVPDRFTAALASAKGNVAIAEQYLFGFDHADIGGDYCIQFNIPVSQSDAIRHHHRPADAKTPLAAHILQTADRLAHATPETDEDVGECVDTASLEALSLAPNQVRPLWEAAVESTAQVMASLTPEAV